jgi:hypothetical protein
MEDRGEVEKDEETRLSALNKLVQYWPEPSYTKQVKLF